MEKTKYSKVLVYLRDSEEVFTIENFTDLLVGNSQETNSEPLSLEGLNFIDTEIYTFKGQSDGLVVKGGDIKAVYYENQ